MWSYYLCDHQGPTLRNLSWGVTWQCPATHYYYYCKRVKVGGPSRTVSGRSILLIHISYCLCAFQSYRIIQLASMFSIYIVSDWQQLTLCAIFLDLFIIKTYRILTENTRKASINFLLAYTVPKYKVFFALVKCDAVVTRIYNQRIN